MEIPKSFKLFGQKISVEMRKALFFEGDKSNGLCLPNENKILIQDNTKKYPHAQDNIEQTFYHEFTHFMLYKLGYDELSQDEKFVEQIASCLHQLQNTMEYSKKTQ
jgi:predicted SprT family Zn-dependent metalloprotease